MSNVDGVESESLLRAMVEQLFAANGRDSFQPPTAAVMVHAEDFPVQDSEH